MVIRLKKDKTQVTKDSVSSQLMSNYTLHGTVIVDPSFAIVACNPAAVKIFADTFNQKLREDVLFTQLFSRGKKFSNDLHQAFTGEIIAQTYKINKRGKSYWFQCDIIPCGNEDSEINFLAIHFRDITTDRRLLISKTRLNSQPKNVDSSHTNNPQFDDFLHIVAHDLRNPLNRLKLLLRNEAALCKGNTQEIIPILRQSVFQMNSIIEGLVHIINFKGADNFVSEVDFTSIIERVMEEYKQDIEMCNIHVTMRISDSRLNYVGPFLESITKNLIGNAIKYVDKAPPQIEVAFGKRRNYYLLLVKDNGAGIDMKKYGKQLFQPFKRFHKNKSGLGIGLFMIKNLVERNGGKIEVESGPGEGSTFKIFLKEYRV